jgi:hypothetical protein
MSHYDGEVTLAELEANRLRLELQDSIEELNKYKKLSRNFAKAFIKWDKLDDKEYQATYKLIQKHFPKLYKNSFVY